MVYVFAVLKGPFAATSAWGRVLGVVLIVVVTIVTQLGGPFVWAVLGVTFSTSSKFLRWLFTPIAVVLVYLVFNIYVFPVVAQVFGRVPLECYSSNTVLRPQNLFYCLANRHYVTDELATVTEFIARNFRQQLPDRNIYFLDAGFPIGAGFPMIPHLSHGDGRRLDLMFLYQNAAGKPVDGNGSPIGYFAFEQPPADAISPCPNNLLTLRWNMTWLQPLFAKPKLDVQATRTLLDIITRDPRIRKILLETHLTNRLGVGNLKVRFQGCRAARHDDHLHIQL